MRALAQSNKHNKDNKMQVNNKSVKLTPPNKVLTGIKYSLAFAVALSVNVELNYHILPLFPTLLITFSPIRLYLFDYLAFTRSISSPIHQAFFLPV